jgi:P4 family phage/plasmid primase-like protien
MAKKIIVKANSLDKLKALAATAPPEEVKSTTQSIRKGKNVDSGASHAVDLGPLDVEKYLFHYGVEFRKEVKGNKTVYKLNQCLFDPNHGKDEGAIIQDTRGLLTYWCFHDSCNHKWADARSMISGQDKIAQFCENYDPDFKPQEKKSPLDTGKDHPDPPPRVPPPESVDPSIFFDGKKLRSQYLAKYLQGHLQPIIFDDADFYIYDKESGVWKVTSANLIGQAAERALDKYATNNLIESSIKLLGKRTIIHPDDFKHNNQFLNVKNGMFEIETGKMYPHDSKYLSRIQMPVEYDENAPFDLWDKFLGEIFVDDLEKILALQSYYGYCLLQDCRYQKSLFMVGDGANGKSVACDVLINILGENNVCSLPLELMGERFLIVELKDKLVNVASEIETSKLIGTRNFKTAVAGGMIQADQKHGKSVKFYPVAKHVFSMNDVPKITDKSHGFQRRPLVLKFNQRFEPGMDKWDPLLLDKLLKQKNGIFAWMIDGLKTILDTGGLYVPEVVEKDTKRFIQLTNPVIQFIQDCCMTGPDYKVVPMELYNEYKKWCEEGKNRPLSRNRFYAQIMVHCSGVTETQDGPERRRVYLGVGLKTSWS